MSNSARICTFTFKKSRLRTQTLQRAIIHNDGQTVAFLPIAVFKNKYSPGALLQSSFGSKHGGDSSSMGIPIYCESRISWDGWMDGWMDPDKTQKTCHM